MEKNKKFKKISIGDVFFVIVLVLIVAFTAHFTLIDRLGFWRLLYPVQAQFSIWSIHCSNDAPVWMKESLKYIIKNQKNLSNQLAYVDQNGQIHTCESGWEKTTLFSKPVSDHTRFRYASMTKIITNDAIIQLVNSGKLQLDDRLVSFFDELMGKKFKDDRVKDITIGDLLQQRSGFDRMRSEDVVFAIGKTPWCPTQLTKLLEIKLDFEPNQRYAYDNRNTCLLGKVIEQVTGVNYRDYIQQQYKLTDKNIKFVDGEYFPDEVRYDFRNNDFWMEHDDNSFDFGAISSSAGLSGSAKGLAEMIKPMLKQYPLSILNIAEDNLENCKTTQFQSCNGYAMRQYQKNLNSPKMYFRNGGLPATTSLAMVTAKHEVIVWTSNGATLYDENYQENFLEKYFYQVLN
ncbi:serine hydrolase [Acinetobacter haemolyticus]|uniref:serine hydrolase n=1 Tax=Acinetobacter haemolyticus TaxID=29430 RepID=UPI0021CD8D50|nr:serine hydrolase domain-containing protein [Acinetobacter haemolyticus]MCU4378576.1 beta-lactamase family protein [Acinetobacter haemolyticus]